MLAPLFLLKWNLKVPARPEARVCLGHLTAVLGKAPLCLTLSRGWAAAKACEELLTPRRAPEAHPVPPSLVSSLYGPPSRPPAKTHVSHDRELTTSLDNPFQFKVTVAERTTSPVLPLPVSPAAQVSLRAHMKHQLLNPQDSGEHPGPALFRSCLSHRLSTGRSPAVCTH